MNLEKIAFAILLFVIVSCKQGSTYNTTEKGKILQSFMLEHRKFNELNKYKVIFILPSSGCDGCISSAESFLTEDYLKKNGHSILFVVTGHSSSKAARLRLGKNAIESADVLCDYTGTFSRQPFYSEYPKIVYLSNGMLEKDSEINPSNSSNIYPALQKIAFQNN